MVNHPCPPPHGSSGAAASESSLGVRTPKEAIPEVSISPSPLSPSWPESQASGGLGHRRPSSILPIRCAGPAEDTVALGVATRTRWAGRGHCGPGRGHPHPVAGNPEASRPICAGGFTREKANQSEKRHTTAWPRASFLGVKI